MYILFMCHIAELYNVAISVHKVQLHSNLYVSCYVSAEVIYPNF